MPPASALGIEVRQGRGLRCTCGQQHQSRLAVQAFKQFGQRRVGVGKEADDALARSGGQAKGSQVLA